MTAAEKVAELIGDEDKCSECGTETSRVYCDNGDDILAERCSLCRWQINMAPAPHRVPFGTEPEEHES
jgi:hypothetical protein